MRRRDFLAGAMSVAISSHPGLAQQRTGIARIVISPGWLSWRTRNRVRWCDAFQSRHARAWLCGRARHLIECRGAGARVEQFPRRARELVDLNPDLIVATNSLAARAVQSATAEIPIVFPVMGDPVGDGLVEPALRVRATT